MALNVIISKKELRNGLPGLFDRPRGQMGKKTQKEAHLGVTLMRDRFKGQRVTRDKDSQALVRGVCGASPLLLP
jgi:hypothetical protein